MSRSTVAPTNQLLEEHKQHALEYFPRKMFPLTSATKPVQNRGRDSKRIHKNSITGPELSYNHSPTVVPPHHWKLKFGVPVMIVRHIIHIHLLNRKILIVTSIFCSMIRLSVIDEHTDSQNSLLLLCIGMGFCICGSHSQNSTALYQNVISSNHSKSAIRNAEESNNGVLSKPFLVGSSLF